MEKVKISTEFIKLDQFLKWSGFVASGLEAKELIINGKIKVNGNTELQRGKKLRAGDIVDAGESSFQIE